MHVAKQIRDVASSLSNGQHKKQCPECQDDRSGKNKKDRSCRHNRDLESHWLIHHATLLTLGDSNTKDHHYAWVFTDRT